VGRGGNPSGIHAVKGHCVVAVPPPVASGGERAQKQGLACCCSVVVGAGNQLFLRGGVP